MVEIEKISIELQKLEIERQKLWRRIAISFFPGLFLILIFAGIWPHPVVGFFAFLFLLQWISIYREKYASKYTAIVSKAKAILVKNYIENVHPNIGYVLDTDGRNGKDIIRQTGLAKGDLCREGDVIEGHYGEAAFYISEIHSFDAIDEESSFILLNNFKGLLFRVKYSNHKFPDSIIENKRNLKKKYGVSGFKRNEEFNFWYWSENDEEFKHQLSPLFPFIKHLVGNQNDIRIQIKNAQITILIDSKIGFLDNPKFRIWRSIVKEQYLLNMEKQLNSLFYIIETFLEGVDRSDILGKLELNALKVKVRDKV